jgi:hypothetical protein
MPMTCGPICTDSETGYTKDLQVAFQTLATDASSKPKRKPKRKLQDMDVKDMDKRSKSARKETLKRKIARSDALTAMDVRQARDLGISIP